MNPSMNSAVAGQDGRANLNGISIHQLALLSFNSNDGLGLNNLGSNFSRYIKILNSSLRPRFS